MAENLRTTKYNDGTDIPKVVDDYKWRNLTTGAYCTLLNVANTEIIAILKSMEVNVLRERTIKGIEAARARGVNGGRPAGSYNKKKASAVVTLYKQKNSINFIEDNLNISRSTIYQYLRKEGVMVKGFKKSKLLK
jgi:DNA invertase Pin-like site-specific DNA recombinase